MLEVIGSCNSCCSPRRLFFERRGEAVIRRQAVTPARYDEGTLATSHNGRGDTITLAHPEGPYMQMHRKLRHEPKQSGEFGE